MSPEGLVQQVLSDLLKLNSAVLYVFRWWFQGSHQVSHQRTKRMGITEAGWEEQFLHTSAFNVKGGACSIGADSVAVRLSEHEKAHSHKQHWGMKCDLSRPWRWIAGRSCRLPCYSFHPDMKCIKRTHLCVILLAQEEHFLKRDFCDIINKGEGKKTQRSILEKE